MKWLIIVAVFFLVLSFIIYFIYSSIFKKYSDFDDMNLSKKENRYSEDNLDDDFEELEYNSQGDDDYYKKYKEQIIQNNKNK